MTEQTGNNKPNEAEKAHTTTPPDGWFYMGSHVGAPWLNLEFSEEMDETGLPLWERPVQHTPTDDEREALATVIAKTWAEDDITPPTDYDFADAILHAGFHRTEPQGEPSDAGVDDAWWKAQEAGQLPRTPGPSIRQAFKAGYRAALRGGCWGRGCAMSAAEAWDSGYEAGAEDQAECEGHRYRPENTSDDHDHWTLNPFREVPVKQEGTEQ